MKKNYIRIHLLSLCILVVGFVLSILIKSDRSGIGGTGKMLALFALAIIGCSFLMRGKLIPLITSSGYFVSFLFAFFFQRDGLDPGGGATNNFWGLWIIVFFICFVLSLFFEFFYVNKHL